MDLLLDPLLGTPLWMWLSFIAIVGALLAFDLGVLHRGAREIGATESLALSTGYAALGLAFGGWVWMQLGREAGIEYVTGFAVEKSLALDNVFLIATVFGALAIPPALQHRVLFWGVIGVIVLRAIMIGLGATLVESFSWVLYLFAAFLMATGLKMLLWKPEDAGLPGGRLLAWLRRRMRLTERLHGEQFLVRLRDPGTGRMRVFATPLLLALVMIEIVDLVFAVDSVPAIFAITTDPFIVYTSNIFAILGLRALYFALATMVHRFAGLKPALAVLLVFIGSKIFVADLLGWEKFPAEWALAGTVLILGVGVLASLRRAATPRPPLTQGEG